MKKEKNEESIIEIDLKKYPVETARYAAYALSGGAFVSLRPGRRKGTAEAVFSARPGTGLPRGLAKLLARELEDEKLRAAMAASSARLREYLFLKALTAPEGPAPAADSGLTPDQERELDDIIAQVEKEIKAETGGRAAKDPLGIKRTWEEANDKRKAGGKKK